MPSAWTVDRLAWHGAGNEYRHQSCFTAMAELQLVQRLSSLPSVECLITLYLTNAGEAFAFPYQAVRIPFDEMRRHRVINLLRGCRWGASASGLHRYMKQTAINNVHPRQPRLEAQAAPGWRGERTANHLKSNQPQSTKGRGTAELPPQPPKNHKQSGRRGDGGESSSDEHLAAGTCLLMHTCSHAHTHTVRSLASWIQTKC